ncbi:uncharacterized protein LOC122814917 [Protopterus annectens]|uniref:uncharacterized protein LOC122814917 n=1 Tax=Protopterus annectens TaxID=7888 RepID=UPI001CFBE819|nr:uncharacterized protein LOC122814917 [Protopterus annectens]
MNNSKDRMDSIAGGKSMANVNSDNIKLGDEVVTDDFPTVVTTSDLNTKLLLVSVVYLILDSRGSVIPAKSSCLEAVSAAYAQNGMLVEKSTAKDLTNREYHACLEPDYITDCLATHSQDHSFDKLPELSTMSALHLKNHYRLPPFCVKKAHMNISKCASDSAVSMHRHNTSGLSLQNIPDVAKQKILQNPVEVSAFHNIVRDLTNRRKKILSSEDMMNKRTKQKKLQNKKQKKTISVSASRTKSIETNASEFRLSPESLDRVYHNRCSRVGSGSLSTAPLHSESGLTGTTHRVLSGSFINRKTRRGLRRESRALSAC